MQVAAEVKETPREYQRSKVQRKPGVLIFLAWFKGELSELYQFLEIATASIELISSTTIHTTDTGRGFFFASRQLAACCPPFTVLIT